MAPLNEENDDEDDSTLFDIKYRFEFSKWHQNSSSCGTKQIIFLLLSCSNMTILFHRPLWGCFSLCSVDGSPFSHFHCRLTHNYFLKGRRCPVYLHSNMFPGARVRSIFSSNFFPFAGEHNMYNSSFFQKTTPAWLQMLLVHGFYLFKLLL